MLTASEVTRLDIYCGKEKDEVDAMREKNAFPLLLARQNQTVSIIELRGGQHFREKCINQGIVPGQNIEVLNNTGRGPCVVSVDNAKVIIGYGMLNRIFVKKI
jgi:Fe2+ transport system protein FeoA